jgi:rhamnosyltransferase
MFKFCATVILYNPENSVLEALKRYSKLFEKVYVMDNSEKINNLIKTCISDIKSIEYYDMNGNKGISHALNIAFKKAIEEGFDFILTMDQDSIFLEDDIKFMMNYINKNDRVDVGIYATNYSRQYFDKKRREFIYTKPRIPKHIIKNVTWAMTSGSFVKLSVIKEIMPIDENYFIAYVDIDLCIQMKLAGYSIVMVGGAVFYQQIGKIVNNSLLRKLLRFTDHASIRYYYMIRNNFYFRNKYRNNIKIKILSYKLFLKYIFKIATSERNKIEKIKLGYLGYCDYKRRLMGKKDKMYNV